MLTSSGGFSVQPMCFFVQPTCFFVQPMCFSVQANCGTCVFCLDKSKFGGPNKLKQKCVVCSAIKPSLYILAKIFKGIVSREECASMKLRTSSKNPPVTLLRGFQHEPACDFETSYRKQSKRLVHIRFFLHPLRDRGLWRKSTNDR
jgi:hypothetical protein